MKKKIGIFDHMMSEVICFGGIPVTRGTAYKIARELQPSWKSARDGMFGPDYQAMHPKAIDAEPWTLAEARDLFINDNLKIPERFIQAA